MFEVSIGKFTLESLTSGMYLDSMVLFREYIQNSIDSIDEAIDRGLLKPCDAEVVITVDKDGRRIIIEDNGLGIPSSFAGKILLDVGNSKKLYTKRRGFRGIGRLVGLSYSQSLTFETSFPGETVATVIEFNNNLLNELLTPGQYEEYDLKAVLREVTKVYQRPESTASHYFRVVLSGIEDVDEVLDEEYVHEYISQVAPLPYNSDKFSFAEQIHRSFEEEGIRLEEYAIFLIGKDGEKSQLFKPNRDKYLVDKQRKLWDVATGIEIEKIYGVENQLLAMMWYAKSGFQGTILNDSIKGIRVRKGNILIGGKTTLNRIFKEERFNGWFQGEIYVLDSMVFPNSRRDDFEKNKCYHQLFEALTASGNQLSKMIREISATRNQGRVIGIKTMDLIYEEDILVMTEANDFSKASDAVKELQSIRNAEKSSKYEILNVSTKLTHAEKKTLEKTFDVILQEAGEADGQRIILAVLDKLNII